MGMRGNAKLMRGVTVGTDIPADVARRHLTESVLFKRPLRLGMLPLWRG